MKNPDITPELQIEINRAKWIQALRENGYRQCTEVLSDGQGNVCALGLAEELFDSGWFDLGPLKPNDCGELMKPAHDNDHGWTFAQIANAAEQGRYW